MDPLERKIASPVDSISGLAGRAAAQNAPFADSIVRDQSRDVRRNERTLDGLLDFCLDPKALSLYKKLCRHDFAIDPAATAEYVRAYARCEIPIRPIIISMPLKADVLMS